MATCTSKTIKQFYYNCYYLCVFIVLACIQWLIPYSSSCFFFCFFVQIYFIFTVCLCAWILFIPWFDSNFLKPKKNNIRECDTRQWRNEKKSFGCNCITCARLRLTWMNVSLRHSEFYLHFTFARMKQKSSSSFQGCIHCPFKNMFCLL